jgi:hypothetical protein
MAVLLLWNGRLVEAVVECRGVGTFRCNAPAL